MTYPFSVRAIRRVGYARLLASLLLLPQTAAVRATESPCDPHLVVETDPQGYKLRGDRCEGLFARPMAGSVLRVVSFTQGSGNFDPNKTGTVSMGWTSLGTGPSFLRAESLRYGMYYRMDTVRPAGEVSYLWPTDLLKTLNLAPVDLGLRGWTRLRLGTTEQDVHLPLRIASTGAQASPEYRLVVVPSEQIDGLVATVHALKPDGTTGADVFERRVPDTFYPVERPIVVSLSLPTSTPTGVYQVVIAATRHSGGAFTMPLWFAHVGT